MSERLLSCRDFAENKQEGKFDKLHIKAIKVKVTTGV